MLFETQSLKYLLFLHRSSFVACKFHCSYLDRIIAQTFCYYNMYYYWQFRWVFYYATNTFEFIEGSVFFITNTTDKPTNENILKSHIKQTLDPKCKKRP